MAGGGDSAISGGKSSCFEAEASSSLSRKPRCSEVICICRLKAVVRTSNTSKNPGKKFWGCLLYGKGVHCNFFHWYNTPPCRNCHEFRKQYESEKMKLEKERLKVKMLWWGMAAMGVLVMAAQLNMAKVLWG